MRVIGLAGKARSGKNYLAREILRPEGYMPLCLASSFKAQLAAEGVIPGDEAVGRADKSERTRHILQLYGTELGRERFHEDIWCVALEWWIAWFVENDYDRFVITDVRYPNEVKWIRQMGGTTYMVTGRGGLEGGLGQHKSESSLDELALMTVDNSPGRDLSEVKEDLLKRISLHYAQHPEPTL